MTTSAIQFEAKLCRPASGEAWLFLRLPTDASNQIPTRSIASVDVVVAGPEFQDYVHPDGEGGHWLKFAPEIVAEHQLVAGMVVEIKLTPCAVEPEPKVPDDLAQALEQTPAARTTWDSTTAISRRDWIQWMTSGKKAETRGIRLEKAMDMLAKGKKRVCCYDRSGMYDKSLSCPAAADD